MTRPDSDSARQLPTNLERHLKMWIDARHVVELSGQKDTYRIVPYVDAAIILQDFHFDEKATLNRLVLENVVHEGCCPVLLLPKLYMERALHTLYENNQNLPITFVRSSELNLSIQDLERYSQMAKIDQEIVMEANVTFQLRNLPLNTETVNCSPNNSDPENSKNLISN